MVFCTFLFITCLVGSIAIFVFAVGLETADPIINHVMTVLIENAVLVVAAFGLFNSFLLWSYFRNKKKGSS